MDIQADVIVVGSGVAGALLADRLAGVGMDVAMLEAGRRVDRSAALLRFHEALIKTPESPYPPTPAADFPLSHDPDHWYRQSGPDTFKSTYLKVVGGTTWHWLGTCLRHLPSDFRLRSRYGQGVDWPVQYGELEPFYQQAEAELGVAGDSGEDLGSPRSGGFPMPAISQTWLDRVITRALEGTDYRVRATPQARNSVVHEGRPPCCGSASCIPICPVQAKYDATVHLQRAQRKGLVLYEETTATFVEVGPDRQISAIRYKRPDGSGGRVRGRVFAIAAHAIETPRLLLNSRSEAVPDGVANSSGQVGRNLMDHPVQLSWALSAEPVWPYRGPISTSGIENLRDGPFRSDRAAFRIQISNDGWSWPTGAPVSLAGDLVSQGLRGEALRRELREQASRHVQLAALMEQLPDPANRVLPDPHARDPYGVPLPQIRYRVDDYCARGLAAARQAHDDIFSRLNATQVQHHREFQGAGHIIGTCKMGDDPGSSVVDRHCRSHDHPNLFLLGSGVFPTSATANPTLTIAALSLRLATEIQRTVCESC